MELLAGVSGFDSRRVLDTVDARKVASLIAWRWMRGRENPPDVLTVRDRIDVEGPEYRRVVYERLRAWLESGAEDDGTRMLFVGVRRSLNRITGDVELLARVARRLQAQPSFAGGLDV